MSELSATGLKKNMDEKSAQMKEQNMMQMMDMKASLAI